MVDQRTRSDRPRSLFVFNLVAFGSLPILLVAFFAAWLNVPYAYQVFGVLLVACWLTCAACWLWYMSGKLSDK
jgi:hypothetical protein